MRPILSLFTAAVLLVLFSAPGISGQSCDWSWPPSHTVPGPVDHTPPDSVTVVPVFFVPTDRPEPSEDLQALFMVHLNMVQERYLTLLEGRTTFRLSRDVIIHHGQHPLDYYRGLGQGGVPGYIAELMDRVGHNRFTLPYIFFVVVMNPDEDFPVGSGRPINGGYNSGGGIVAMSSFVLAKSPLFQSTARHELGHAFGLPHVNVYGYDMGTNPSLMSYNLRHHTRGLEDSEEPGIFILEDLRGLAMNDRAIPNLEYHRPDTTLGPPIWLGPLDTIPGRPDGLIKARTPSGEMYGTQARNAVQNMIQPSAGPGVRFDAYRMWHSAEVENEIAILELEFPLPVTLDSIAVHSGHSGQYHPALTVRVEAEGPEGPFEVADAPLFGHDDGFAFEPATARHWCLVFHTSESRYLTLRGLEFFNGIVPIFPPWVPYQGPGGGGGGVISR